MTVYETVSWYGLLILGVTTLGVIAYESYKARCKRKGS